MAHIPGKFVWFELNTTDIDSAKRFYGELLGWKISAAEMNGISYEMINNGDNSIGGVVPSDSASHWASYLSVDDVDEAVKKIEKGGGKLLTPAVDFPSVGRFAKVADPQGGEFFAFHSEHGDPEDRDSAQGDWFWNELWTSDDQAALLFYEKNLGFAKEKMPGGDYYLLKSAGAPRAGVMKSPVEDVPVNWLPYVHVDDTDATVSRAKKLGAKVMKEAADIPEVGRFAILKDPEGAAIAVMTPAAKK